jgi:hypothetical protein
MDIKWTTPRNDTSKGVCVFTQQGVRILNRSLHYQLITTDNDAYLDSNDQLRQLISINQTPKN